MDEKVIKKVHIAILALIICGGVFFVGYRKTLPRIEKNKIKISAFIPYASAFNYRQSTNDCGPYNTAAVVRAIKNIAIDSREFAKEIQWRLPNKYTLPWGLENQLENHGMTIEKPDVRSFSDEEKTLFLQQQLSLGKAVILLGAKNNFQHYLTIFGFTALKDEFYVYDSLYEENSYDTKLTADHNGSLPGNRTLSSKSLMDFWRKGGKYGVYHWYALVAGG